MHGCRPILLIQNEFVEIFYYEKFIAENGSLNGNAERSGEWNKSCISYQFFAARFFT